MSKTIGKRKRFNPPRIKLHNVNEPALKRSKLNNNSVKRRRFNTDSKIKVKRNRSKTFKPPIIINDTKAQKALNISNIGEFASQYGITKKKSNKSSQYKNDFDTIYKTLQEFFTSSCYGISNDDIIKVISLFAEGTIITCDTSHCTNELFEIDNRDKECKECNKQFCNECIKSFAWKCEDCGKKSDWSNVCKIGNCKYQGNEYNIAPCQQCDNIVCYDCWAELKHICR
eukprot:234319_1